MNESPFPIGDWQFWVASLAVLGALAVLIKPLVARRRRTRACPNCTDSGGSPGAPRRADLTVEGARPKSPTNPR